VRWGDTLWGLSRRYGTTVWAIVRANNLRSTTIYAGQRLVIPAGGAVHY
jgi:LysM repeat protein